MLINFYPPPIPQFPRKADEKPADYLRRQWVTRAWTTTSWGERLMFVVAILLWWPTTILLDRKGVVRYRHIGEGQYDETEATIRRLLGENA